MDSDFKFDFEKYSFSVESPVTFTSPLVNQQVTENGEVTLSAKLSKVGKDVKWFKDGNKPLKHGKKYDIKAAGVSHSLRIPKVSMDDAGGYTLKVGTIESSCSLSVKGETIRNMFENIFQKHRETALCIFLCFM